MTAYLKHGYMTQGPFRDEAVEQRPHPKGLSYGRKPNPSGYGTDLPCGVQVFWEGLWRDCLVMVYGNGGGTPYIKTRGERIYVGGL